jgi:hypothetical protein
MKGLLDVLSVVGNYAIACKMMLIAFNQSTPQKQYRLVGLPDKAVLPWDALKPAQPSPR